MKDMYGHVKGTTLRRAAIDFALALMLFWLLTFALSTHGGKAHAVPLYANPQGVQTTPDRVNRLTLLSFESRGSRPKSPNERQSLGLLSLAFALLLNSPRLLFKGPLRALVYLPVMIPLVASTLVWIGFLNTDTGWLNAILTALGLPAPDWINSETWIYPALSIIGLWSIGNFMIINLAGLQSVPTELYEAARMDGAGFWTTLRRITIPLS